jgi:A/G-specific adenine glycosylase
MLEKRPPSGIWGGLWSLPEAGLGDKVDQICQQRWGLSVLTKEDCAVFRHTFSHYHFEITPCKVSVVVGEKRVKENSDITWCISPDAQKRALAAPVARIISRHA